MGIHKYISLYYLYEYIWHEFNYKFKLRYSNDCFPWLVISNYFSKPVLMTCKNEYNVSYNVLV